MSIAKRVACLTLAVLPAGLVVAPAHGAVAGLEDDQLVSAPLDTLKDRMDRLKKTRTRVARFGVFWNEVARTRPAKPTDPNDRSYDWTRVDIIVRGLAARGITPIATIYSTPEWAAGRALPGEQVNPFAPTRSGDFAAFATAAAKRYNGKFIPAAYSSVGALPRVRIWEIWNEPNLKRYLRTSSGSTSLPVYLRLVREGYPAIKAANPQSIVLAGSTGPRGGGFSDGSMGARPWLKGLMRSPLDVKFDAYSQHIYPSVGPLSKRRVFPGWTSFPEIFAEMDGRRDREIAAAKGAAKAKLMRAPKMKVFITEAGYTTLRTTERKTVVSLSQQALYLSQMFGLPDVKNPRVPVVVWFNMQDNRDWPGGLFTAGWKAKPSLQRFLAVARKGSLPPELRR